MNILIQLVYNLLYSVVFIFVAPYYGFRMMKRGKSGQDISQRFGLFGWDTRARIVDGRDGIWIHAVSVGEVNLAVLLIQQWRDRWPSVPVLLSTTTVTGRAVAQKQLPPEVTVIYNPLDFWLSVNSVFELIRPRLLVLVESEVWPNYFWEAERRHIPIVMVNARLSKRTERHYHELGWFVRPLLRQMECVCVQNETDRERFLRLGLETDRVVNTGSMKYDVSRVTDLDGFDAEGLMRQAGWTPERPVFLAGSTHKGEEEIVGKIFQHVRVLIPNLFMVVAPRHFERGGEVSRLYDKLGLDHVRRSKLGTASKAGDVLILDSTGELKYFYRHSDVTFIGKSLTGRGGQNFLEAVQAGRPVLFGPHMENFEVIADAFLEARAVLQISNARRLQWAITHCLSDPEYSGELACKAKKLFEEQCGATLLTVNALKPWIFAGRAEEAEPELAAA